MRSLSFHSFSPSLLTASDALHLRPSPSAPLQRYTPYPSATAPSLQPAAPFLRRRRPTLGGWCPSRGVLPLAGDVLHPVGGCSAPPPPPPRSTALFPRRVVPYPWRSAPQPRRPPPGWQRPLLGDSTLAAHGGASAKPPWPRAAASSASNEQWRRGRIRRWWHRRRPRVDPAAVAAAEGGSGRLFFSFFFLLEFIFYFFGIGHWDS